MSASDALFRLLLIVLVAAPLPLGAHRPWAWSLLAVLMGALLVGWGSLALAGRVRPPLKASTLTPIALPFALVWLWGLVQSLPGLPAGWWHPLWSEAAAALPGQPVRGTISLDPAAGHAALLRLALYAGMFWLALQLGRDRGRARLGLRVLAGAGIAYAVYGLSLHFAGIEAILWYPKWAYLGDLTASFVNRNAYGAYAGLGVLACLALFVRALRPDGTRGARAAAERLLLRALPAALGLAIIATALLLSHSRGAFLATLAGAGILLLALAIARLASRRLILLLMIGLGGLSGALLTLSGGATLDRLVDSTERAGDRGQLVRLTLTAIEDAPWTGHGLGSFATAFRIYRDSSLPREVVYDFAHSVPLELAMDLGLPAAGLYGLSFIAIAVLCLRALRRRRRDQVHPALALAAMVLLGGHGLIDFSVQMPAIALTLAYLLGVGVAQSWNSESAPGEND